MANSKSASGQMWLASFVAIFALSIYFGTARAQDLPEDATRAPAGPTAGDLDQPPLPAESLPPVEPQEEALVGTPQPGTDRFDRDGPRDLLKLSGIDESHMRQLIDSVPLDLGEQEVLLKILYRVRNFDPMSIARWTSPRCDFAALATDPNEHRARMFLLRGRIEGLAEEKPPVEVVARFEMDHYYVAEARLGEDRVPVQIVTTRIPQDWQVGAAINERISAQGLFLKVGEVVDGKPQLVFVAPRIAWHPDTVHEGGTRPATNFGMTVLGDLGMDVGLLDHVQDRGKIQLAEREAFYQMLWAVEFAGTKQLLRNAKLNLPQLAKVWAARAEELKAETESLLAQQKSFQGTPQERDKLDRKIQRTRQQYLSLKRGAKAAEEGEFSIFPLFNFPEEQRGRLVLLEGVARRAVKIEIGNSRGGSNSDIFARFGVDHYYEIEIFNDESRNNPIVFCMRSLPQGFPVGEDIHELVQMGGFFFKSWAYHTQKGMEAGPDGILKQRKQLAPLLIGRQPVWIRPPEAAKNPYFGIIAGGLFALAVLGIWLGVWRFSREDQEFHERTIAKEFAVEEGTSLDDLDIQAETEPDFSHLE